MRVKDRDTIAAISTPMGEGGIGIVRASGPLALAIADRLFQSSRRTKPSTFPSHTLHQGFIIDPERGEKVDEVLLAIMRSPHSYTAEDIIEINGHGGLVPLLRILELVLEEGARLADPGEFTRRAFLNGRIDLAQAEAVLEIIRAKSERGLKLAMRHLDGTLSRRIKELRGRLLSLSAEVEAAIDFPEEDLQILSEAGMEKEMEEVLQELRGLTSSFQEGRLFQEGIVTALIGRSNVGKSSLFNALLQRERAIVTPYPGTTRDSLEEVLSLEGLPFRLIDTAGMRRDESRLDLAEQEGVERGKAWAEKADLLLLVVDGSEALTEQDRGLLREVKGRKGLLLLNKTDLEVQVKTRELAVLGPDLPCLKVSARTGAGLGQLREAMVEAMKKGGLDLTQDLVITHLHHRKALEEAERALLRGKEALSHGLSSEFVGLDLRESVDALGEITGETTSEDLLAEIFSRFCIGK
jgi:tRNA modification GTPase